MMKQFLFTLLFITIFASSSEARVQKATGPSKKIWSTPFIRPQFFNVRHVLEKTNGNLYPHDNSEQPAANKKTQPTKPKQQQVITGELLEVFSATPFNES